MKLKICILKSIRHLSKKLKAQINRKIFCVQVLKELILLKYPNYPIYRFHTFPIKILLAFFTEIEKKNPKIGVGQQKTSGSQSNTEEKKKKLKAS